MEPILSREEIADLLTAVKTGRIPLEPPAGRVAARPGRVLPTRALDLVRTYERGHESGESRLPNFDIVLDTFARNIGVSLTNALQRTFTVAREEILVRTFHESLEDLEHQGAVGIYTMAPLKSGCLFHFDTRLAFTLLEMMLGAARSGESPALERHLTTIEMSILKTTMAMLASELERAMRPVVELQIGLARVENNFRMVNIVEPEAEVLVCRFGLRLGDEEAGRMRCIVPYLSFEPLRDKFRNLVHVGQAAARGWARLFAREVLAMECEVAARSGLIPMTIRRLLALRAGEVIEMPYNPDQPLTVLVEDQPLFTAIAGERNGCRAVHVTGRHSHPRGTTHGDT